MFALYRIPVYSGFSLDSFHCIHDKNKLIINHVDMWHWDGTMGKQLRLPQENGNNAQG